MSTSVMLFCEGDNSSPDRKVLEKLFPNPPIIVPLGGKFGSPAYIEGYLKAGRVIQPKYAFLLKDRDFDYPIPETAQLIDAKPKNGSNGRFFYATYRSAIENYLIDSQLVCNFLVQKGLAITQEEIHSVFKEAALAIKEYSAVRHALGKLRKPLNLKTTWVKEGSGHLPTLETLMSLELLKKEAHVLISEFEDSANSISIEDFDKILKDFKDRFDAESFWQNNEYMIWFHGKDLQKAISHQFEIQKIKIGSWDSYFTYAMENIDFVNKFPELKEFQQIVIQKITET
jgi:hypothetical protein